MQKFISLALEQRVLIKTHPILISPSGNFMEKLAYKYQKFTQTLAALERSISPMFCSWNY